MDPAERHTKKKLRTFIALRVKTDRKTTGILDDIREVFRSENIVWNRKQNFHVTLLFIGDTSPEMLLTVQESIERIAAQTRPFQFHIEGLGIFRTINHPRVLWLGTGNTELLAELKDRTDKALFPVLKIESMEKFKPHLTIGRMRRIIDLKLLKETMQKYDGQVFQKVVVKEIIFYESITTPEGPVYRVLSVHPLT